MARLTDHNVVGTFPDLDKAREVIEELNHARDDKEAARATEILEREGADRVDHLDQEGRPFEDQLETRD